MSNFLGLFLLDFYFSLFICENNQVGDYSKQDMKTSSMLVHIYSKSTWSTDFDCVLFIIYKIKMKKTFVFYSDRIDYTQEMTDTEKWQFLDLILNYQNWIAVDPQWWMKFIRSRIKKQIDEDNEKRNEIVEKRKIAWQIWWKNHSWNQYTKQDTKWKAQKNTLEANESKWKQTGTMEAVNVNDNVNENDIKYQTKFDEISNEISDFTQKQIETDENRWKQLIVKNELWIEEKEKNSAKKEKEFWNSEINELIDQIKTICDQNGIAYDRTDDRKFARHILTANAFGDFCEKIWQSRIEFAKNVLIASVKIWFRKWPCSWPKKIYQNFADVFNETMSKKQKKFYIPSI